MKVWQVDSIPEGEVWTIVDNQGAGGRQLMRWTGEDWEEIKNVSDVAYEANYFESTFTAHVRPHLVLIGQGVIQKNFWVTRDDGPEMEEVSFDAIYTCLANIAMRSSIAATPHIERLVTLLGLDFREFRKVLNEALPFELTIREDADGDH